MGAAVAAAMPARAGFLADGMGLFSEVVVAVGAARVCDLPRGPVSEGRRWVMGSGRVTAAVVVGSLA